MEGSAVKLANSPPMPWDVPAASPQKAHPHSQHVSSSKKLAGKQFSVARAGHGLARQFGQHPLQENDYHPSLHAQPLGKDNAHAQAEARRPLRQLSANLQRPNPITGHHHLTSTTKLKAIPYAALQRPGAILQPTKQLSHQLHQQTATGGVAPAPDASAVCFHAVSNPTSTAQGRGVHVPRCGPAFPVAVSAVPSKPACDADQQTEDRQHTSYCHNPVLQDLLQANGERLCKLPPPTLHSNHSPDATAPSSTVKQVGRVFRQTACQSQPVSGIAGYSTTSVTPAAANARAVARAQAALKLLHSQHIVSHVIKQQAAAAAVPQAAGQRIMLPAQPAPAAVQTLGQQTSSMVSEKTAAVQHVSQQTSSTRRRLSYHVPHASSAKSVSTSSTASELQPLTANKAALRVHVAAQAGRAAAAALVLKHSIGHGEAAATAAVVQQSTAADNAQKAVAKWLSDNSPAYGTIMRQARQVQPSDSQQERSACRTAEHSQQCPASPTCLKVAASPADYLVSSKGSLSYPAAPAFSSIIDGISQGSNIGGSTARVGVSGRLSGAVSTTVKAQHRISPSKQAYIHKRQSVQKQCLAGYSARAANGSSILDHFTHTGLQDRRATGQIGKQSRNEQVLNGAKHPVSLKTAEAAGQQLSPGSSGANTGDAAGTAPGSKCSAAAAGQQPAAASGLSNNQVVSAITADMPECAALSDYGPFASVQAVQRKVATLTTAENQRANHIHSDQVAATPLVPPMDNDADYGPFGKLFSSHPSLIAASECLDSPGVAASINSKHSEEVGQGSKGCPQSSAGVYHQAQKPGSKAYLVPSPPAAKLHTVLSDPAVYGVAANAASKPPVNWRLARHHRLQQQQRKQDAWRTGTVLKYGKPAAASQLTPAAGDMAVLPQALPPDRSDHEQYTHWQYQQLPGSTSQSCFTTAQHPGAVNGTDDPAAKAPAHCIAKGINATAVAASRARYLKQQQQQQMPTAPVKLLQHVAADAACSSDHSSQWLHLGSRCSFMGPVTNINQPHTRQQRAGLCSQSDVQVEPPHLASLYGMSAAAGQYSRAAASSNRQHGQRPSLAIREHRRGSRPEPQSGKRSVASSVGSVNSNAVTHAAQPRSRQAAYKIDSNSLVSSCMEAVSQLAVIEKLVLAPRAVAGTNAAAAAAGPVTSATLASERGADGSNSTSSIGDEAESKPKYLLQDHMEEVSPRFGLGEDQYDYIAHAVQQLSGGPQMTIYGLCCSRGIQDP